MLVVLSVMVMTSIPLRNQRSFGHSVKNGQLPAHTEVSTFEHNCTEAPCVVTQLHVPSIYPPHGESWNWTHGIVNFYIDGEKVPSISITLLELAGESRFNIAGGQSNTDGSPWGIALFGRTAKSGGVYSTVRIPFSTSIRTTIQAPDTSEGESVYWFIIRGLEAHAVLLGDLQLPPEARLALYRVHPTKLDNLELITLATVPRGFAGALLRVDLDAQGTSYRYLEGCMRLLTNGS